MRNVLAIISVIVAACHVLVPCQGLRRGNTAWQNPNVLPRSNPQRESEENPFTVISGWIDDTSNSDESNSNQMPWRHHVNFDEMHPGEDQIAEETDDLVITQPHLRPLFRPFVIARPEKASTENIEEPDRRTVVPLPSFNTDPDREFAHPFLNFQSLWNILGNAGRPLAPWYKGSNVCIKREEEDEIVEADPSESETESSVIGVDDGDDVVGYNDDLIHQFPKDEPFAEVDALNSTSDMPEWHMKLSYCKDLDTKRACYMKLFGPKIKRTISVTYECCHGYVLDERKEKCQRTRYENVAKTIEEMGGTEFLTLIKNTGLLNKITNENITVFVPSNDAVATYLTSLAVDTNTIKFVIGPQTARRRRSLFHNHHNNPQGRSIRRHNVEHHNRPNPVYTHRLDDDDDSLELNPSEEDFDMNDIDWKQNALSQHESHKRNLAYEHEDSQSKLQKTLLSHMIQGKISTDDFVDEKVVFSEERDSVLRMNTWNVGNEEVKTINCARLTSINHRCKNGMVHIIDRMVKPVTKSIAEVIASDPDMSLLNTLIASSGMMQMLSDRSQHLTMFAPTNAAINKLGHSILHKLQNGDPCLKRILRHHLLPISFCTSIVQKDGQVRNIDGLLLDVSRKVDDKLYINGSQILIRDIVTTNGIVHVIDSVLMSENDQPISKALEKDGYSQFLSYLRRAGLEDYIDEQNNVTLFVPSNEAMAEIDQEILRNPAKLREILMYHIVTPETKTCSFSHDLLLPSKLSDRNVRINLYSHFPVALETEITAQCGRLTKANRMACNGVIHEVDRLLIPAELNSLDVLKSQTDFAIFTRFLIESGLSDKLKLSNSSVTVFAPTDTAFMDLPKDVFRNLLENKENATKMVQSHIIDEPLCCAGVAPNNWFMTRNVDCLSGGKVPVYRDANGQVMFGNAKVTTCDLTSSNGVIHTVDKVVTSANDRGEQMESCLLNPIRSATFFIRL